jgi:SLT domain-containing protein
MLLLTLVFAFAVGAMTPAMALSAKKRAVVKVIKKAAKSKHLNKAEIKALLKICKRESDYNPKSLTGSCKGLFQLKTHFSRKKWSDAKWNTLKAIKYIKKRYGSCRKALAHSNSYGWY